MKRAPGKSRKRSRLRRKPGKGRHRPRTRPEPILTAHVRCILNGAHFGLDRDGSIRFGDLCATINFRRVLVGVLATPETPERTRISGNLMKMLSIRWRSDTPTFCRQRPLYFQMFFTRSFLSKFHPSLRLTAVRL